MPTLSHHKSSSTHGSSAARIFLPELLSGAVDVKTSKDILLTYHVTDGSESTSQGADGSKCFDVVTKNYTLTWTAKIDVRKEITRMTVAQTFAANAESAGFGAMVAGGVTTVAGLASGPGEGIAAPIGGAIALLGGIVNRVGKWTKEAIANPPEVHTQREEKSGAGAFTSVTLTQIECLPDHTYPKAPAAATADKGENDLLAQILAGL